MILLGDSNQIDLKNKRETSLDPLLDMFSDIPKIGCLVMDDKDVNVRNPLIDAMEKEFNNYYNRNNVNFLPNGR